MPAALRFKSRLARVALPSQLFSIWPTKVETTSVTTAAALYSSTINTKPSPDLPPNHDHRQQHANIPSFTPRQTRQARRHDRPTYHHFYKHDGRPSSHDQEAFREGPPAHPRQRLRRRLRYLRFQGDCSACARKGSGRYRYQHGLPSWNLYVALFGICCSLQPPSHDQTDPALSDGRIAPRSGLASKVSQPQQPARISEQY